MKITTKVFEIADLKAITEDGKFYLSGYANTKGIRDSHGDIPTNYNGQPVYDLERMNKNPVCFVDHYNSASNIAGNFTELVEDEKGLKFKLLLRSIDKIHNDLVKDAVQAYMDGFGRALSIGGYWMHEDKENPSHLTRAILHEISLVGVGSDGQALTTASYPKNISDCEAKAVVSFQDLPLADREMRWDSTEAINRIREVTGSEENPSATYKNAFLWYDASSPDLFGSYKLPIATEIDGRLYAVPRAIFSAAAVMRGARGGVKLPARERGEVIAHIEKYYDKMGLESPFKDENSFRLDDFNSLEEKELEKLLKTGVCFSGKDAKAIISSLKSSGLRDAESQGLRDAVSEDEIKAVLDKFK